MQNPHGRCLILRPCDQRLRMNMHSKTQEQKNKQGQWLLIIKIASVLPTSMVLIAQMYFLPWLHLVGTTEKPSCLQEGESMATPEGVCRSRHCPLQEDAGAADGESHALRAVRHSRALCGCWRVCCYDGIYAGGGHGHDGSLLGAQQAGAPPLLRYSPCANLVH